MNVTLLWCDQPDVFDPDRPDTLAPVLTSTARAPVPDMALPTPPTPEVPRAETPKTVALLIRLLYRLTEPELRISMPMLG